MCKGTRCTHDSDPAVQYVEDPYDGWVFRYIPLYDSYDAYGLGLNPPPAYLIRVQGRNTYTEDRILGNGPGHDQPMIKIKDDVGRWEHHSDELMRQALYCGKCASQGHQCYDCNKPLPHMAQGKCADCWWTPELTELIENRCIGCGEDERFGPHGQGGCV